MLKGNILEKHFYPFVSKNEIFRTSDEQGEIVVYEVKKFRILTFDSLCEQSKVRIGDPLCLDHEYTQAMLLPLLQITPQHVTLLGLGGGSMASCLYSIFYDLKLVAVEWRQAIIDIAYDYFDLPLDARLEVKRQDAKFWLQRAADSSTDLILSDLYHASDVNEVQLERQFFENCQRILRKRGWLTLNYHAMPTAGSLAVSHLCQYFASVFMLQVNTKNWIVLASKQEITLEAMMATPPNTNLPASLSTRLTGLQARLIKINRNRSSC